MVRHLGILVASCLPLERSALGSQATVCVYLPPLRTDNASVHAEPAEVWEDMWTRESCRVVARELFFFPGPIAYLPVLSFVCFHLPAGRLISGAWKFWVSLFLGFPLGSVSHRYYLAQSVSRSPTDLWESWPCFQRRKEYLSVLAEERVDG